ncbi:MAG: amidohydrolase family protein, partial [Solirubrobacteraceae bacterium]
MTFDDTRTEIPDGVLYIDDTGIIQGVAAQGEPAPTGFDHVARVETGGLVYPGLMDLHNHMAYNCLSLWLAPDHPGAWT